MTPEPTNAATPAAPALDQEELPFPTDLDEEDGEPLESDWHRMEIALLIEILRYYLRARRDFYAGGNMFIYFSAVQARNKDYRGPDFFFVWGVEGTRQRRYWALWEENGKYPNVIVELLSRSTAQTDRTVKKKIYEQTFRTPEYFLYDPDTQQLEGWHLTNGDYEKMEPDTRGWIWSRQLELYLGNWEGAYLETTQTFLRFYDVHGNLVLTGREDKTRHADDEKRRADDEKRRADDAEAELTRLRARLAELEGK